MIITNFTDELTPNLRLAGGGSAFAKLRQAELAFSQVSPGKFIRVRRLNASMTYAVYSGGKFRSNPGIFPLDLWSGSSIPGLSA
jgi:hypothetical protein